MKNQEAINTLRRLSELQPLFTKRECEAMLMGAEALEDNETKDEERVWSKRG